MFRKLTSISPALFSGFARRQYSSIFHVTDPEGSKSFFDAIKKSRIVKYDPVSGLHLNDKNGYVICGGDVTDRGSNDLAITRALVEFKKRHPENVTLLVGNREIKNNRFSIELAPTFIRERLIHSAQPRWLSQRTLPLDYVIADMVAHGKKEHDKNSIRHYVETLSIEQCQIIYLKWMLEKTMGCPNTFRYRREELARLSPGKPISDEDVLRSFLHETAPTGLMGQYLQLANVGVIVPQTRVMAVHGGLTLFNIGRTPDMSPDEPPLADAHQWLAKLNRWYAEQIVHWINYKPIELTEPGCTELDAAVLPIPNKEKFVITADMLNKDRQFIDIPSRISQYLVDNQISVVLTGHQPTGDFPAFLRSYEHPVLFVNGDTSYAKSDWTDPDNTRAYASHALDITIDQQQTKLHVQAALQDATVVEADLTVTPDGLEGDPYIGRLLSDHRLVQCKLADGHYRLIQQNGFRSTYSIVSPEKMVELVSENQPRPIVSK